MGFLNEFKTFAMKGNLVDTSVAFVMGAAFTNVSNSFVGGIFTPPIGLIMSDSGFKDAKLVLRSGIAEIKDAAGNIVTKSVAEVAITWGEFINATINFLIVAFAMFLVVKALNALKKKEEAPEAPAEPSAQEKLLMEIRDLLKK